ncbi:hypothetical protein WAI453_008012 [Rhynchosporium graminicola]
MASVWACPISSLFLPILPRRPVHSRADPIYQYQHSVYRWNHVTHQKGKVEALADLCTPSSSYSKRLGYKYPGWVEASCLGDDTVWALFR